MHWILTLDIPRVGYFIEEVQEKRLDGVPKITAKIAGKFTVVEPNSVHVVIPQTDDAGNCIENYHDVFTSEHDAREFIEDFTMGTLPSKEG